jgi:hypothetical protein
MPFHSADDAWHHASLACARAPTARTIDCRPHGRCTRAPRVRRRTRARGGSPPRQGKPAVEGDALDTVTACPPLTIKEKAEIRTLKARHMSIIAGRMQSASDQNWDRFSGSRRPWCRRRRGRRDRPRSHANRKTDSSFNVRGERRREDRADVAGDGVGGRLFTKVWPIYEQPRKIVCNKSSTPNTHNWEKNPPPEFARITNEKDIHSGQ